MEREEEFKRNLDLKKGLRRRKKERENGRQQRDGEREAERKTEIIVRPVFKSPNFPTPRNQPGVTILPYFSHNAPARPPLSNEKECSCNTLENELPGRIQQISKG